MSLDKILERNLQQNKKKKWIVVGSENIKEISKYLNREKIRHCCVPKQGIVIIENSNYVAIKKLDNSYQVNISDRVYDDSGEKVLEKIKGDYSFESHMKNGSLGDNPPTTEVYNVQHKYVLGPVHHTTKFNREKYSIQKVVDTISYFHGTIEQLFELILDEEVISVEPCTPQKCVK